MSDYFHFREYGSNPHPFQLWVLHWIHIERTISMYVNFLMFYMICDLYILSRKWIYWYWYRYSHLFHRSSTQKLTKIQHNKHYHIIWWIINQSVCICYIQNLLTILNVYLITIMILNCTSYSNLKYMHFDHIIMSHTIHN